MSHSSEQLTPELIVPEQPPTTTLLLPTSEGALAHEFGEHVPATLDGDRVPSEHDSAKLPELGEYPESHIPIGSHSSRYFLTFSQNVRPNSNMEKPAETAKYLL